LRKILTVALVKQASGLSDGPKMTSCRKCLNAALAEMEIAPRQQPINLRAGSITSFVMMPRTPLVRGVGKTEQHRIAR
jgi:hypothetical protein